MDKPVQIAVVRNANGYKIIVQSTREVIRIHNHQSLRDTAEEIEFELSQLEISR